MKKIIFFFFIFISLRMQAQNAFFIRDTLIGPDPATDGISIRLKTHAGEGTTAIVYNSFGEKIGVYSLDLSGKCTPDISGWRTGIYFCTITNRNEIKGETQFIISK